jgi:polysaccharide biosynthesis transport protein
MPRAAAAAYFRPVAVGELYRSLWRRKLIVLATMVLAVAAAVYYTRHQPKTYTAATLVRIQQRITSTADAFGALQTGGRLAQTYAEIAGTNTIARKVYVSLGGRIPYGDVAGSLSGSQIQDLDLLSITATARDPRWAQQIANGAPGALRRFIEQTGTLRDEVVTVQPASLPRGPSSPSLKLNVGAALVLGLVLGAGLALLLELVADRARDLEELERLTRRPVLSTVAKLDLVRIVRLDASAGDAAGRAGGEVGR